jgi:hypothetical protein
LLILLHGSLYSVMRTSAHSVLQDSHSLTDNEEIAATIDFVDKDTIVEFFAEITILFNVFKKNVSVQQ